MTLSHFQSLFSSYSVNPPPEAFEGLSPSITIAHNDQLTVRPDETKIYQAITKLNPTSAPGLDGFTGLQLPSCISSTNLVLLPKKSNVSQIDQLRPISLCNFVHKIISSILNTRLTKVLPIIIGQEQAGFMPDRSMVELIALAHDLTCHINNVISKIDMSKAYDRVS
ncbi:hypothetical protein QQ045_022354 [Rhodiola kirilowii]